MYGSLGLTSSNTDTEAPAERASRSSTAVFLHLVVDHMYACHLEYDILPREIGGPTQRGVRSCLGEGWDEEWKFADSL